MAYIFNYIADIAYKHLVLYYKKGLKPFTTLKEIITYFTKIFKTLFKAQDAYINFYKLIIKDNKSFLDFYT
jgi:hypothetical protein